jgi:hypothetical protein
MLRAPTRDPLKVKAKLLNREHLITVKTNRHIKSDSLQQRTPEQPKNKGNLPWKITIEITNPHRKKFFLQLRQFQP